MAGDVGVRRRVAGDGGTIRCREVWVFRHVQSLTKQQSCHRRQSFQCHHCN